MVMANGSGAPSPHVPATVTVMPDTRGIGLLEFHQIDDAREAGLQAGRAAVAALRQAAANTGLGDTIDLQEPAEGPVAGDSVKLNAAAGT
jgi:hypothetical protein